MEARHRGGWWAAAGTEPRRLGSVGRFFVDCHLGGVDAALRRRRRRRRRGGARAGDRWAVVHAALIGVIETLHGAERWLDPECKPGFDPDCAPATFWPQLLSQTRDYLEVAAWLLFVPTFALVFAAWWRGRRPFWIHFGAADALAELLFAVTALGLWTGHRECGAVDGVGGVRYLHYGLAAATAVARLLPAALRLLLGPRWEARAAPSLCRRWLR